MARGRERRQLARVPEACEIPEFRRQTHRGDERDAAQRLQRRDQQRPSPRRRRLPQLVGHALGAALRFVNRVAILCLGCATPWFLGKKAGYVLAPGTQAKQDTQEQICGDGPVSGFHLGDPGLARAHAPCDLYLCQPEAFTPPAKAHCERQLGFDETPFFRRQPEEIAGIAHGPASAFKAPLLIPFHWVHLSASGSTASTSATAAGNPP